jgi:hypothetical protein
MVGSGSAVWTGALTGAPIEHESGIVLDATIQCERTVGSAALGARAGLRADGDGPLEEDLPPRTEETVELGWLEGVA